MTEDIKKIKLRMFSEGIEMSLEPEEKVNDKMWNQYTECPHCKKKIRIIKWVEKWIGFVF